MKNEFMALMRMVHGHLLKYEYYIRVEKDILLMYDIIYLKMLPDIEIYLLKFCKSCQTNLFNLSILLD